MSFLYVDTNVLIRGFEGELETAKPVLDLLVAFQDRPGLVVTSELTPAEALAPVKAAGARSVEQRRDLYETVFQAGLITVLPITRSILSDTAMLRVNHAQKLPDAIHVVTALQAGCRYLMSSDKDAKRLPASIQHVFPDAAGVFDAIEAARG